MLCIQETKIKDGDSRVIRGNQLLRFESNSKHYGCGFVINKRLSNSIHRFWKVSDRVCVLQIKLEEVVYKKSKTSPLISIINVYAPTSQRVEKYPDKIEQFYKDLNETFTSIRKRELVILAGDFYAKAGQKQGEKCIGRFSKGKRNSNGDKLIEYCEDNKLFITNSTFNHPSRHIKKWSGLWRDKTTDYLRG